MGVADDRVMETSTTTGTGALSLAGAVEGYRGFVAVVGAGAGRTYAIVNEDVPAEWEVGIGTIADATPDTLTRDTIIASSNSNAAVNFSAGTKKIWSDIPARLLARNVRSIDASETLVDTDEVILAANTAARTLTLPAAAGRAGKRYLIIKTTGNSLAVTIDGNSSETIGGRTTWTLCNSGDVLWIECDGSNWQVLNEAPEQAKATTTNATEATLWSKTLTANTAYMFRVQVTAIRTGGTSGAAGDAQWWEFNLAAAREGSNAAAVWSAETHSALQSSAISPAVTFDTSTNDIRLRITGEADVNYSWYAKVTPIFVNRYAD